MNSVPPAAAQQAPWLSIMIPAYDVAPYVEECLTSILDQADAGVQIIICDDCSTDNTRAIIQRMAQANPDRLTALYNPHNLGLSATRNAMFEHAKGEYFWFIDSDDAIRPGAIAAVRTAIETHHPDIVGGDYHKRRIRKFAFAGKRGRYIANKADIVAGICGSRKLYIWIKICHRSLWDAPIRFPVGKLFEDAATVPRLALRANSMIQVRKSLINYRVRPGSVLSGITRTPERFGTERHLDLAHALDGFAAEIDQAEQATPSGDYDRARRAVSHFIAMEYCKIVERIERAGPQGCDAPDIHALARRFHDIMNAASPVAFVELIRSYRKRGRFIAAYKLRKALGFIAQP